MTLFDLLFLLCALASFAALATAGVFALIGRGKAALRILRAWAVAAAIYLAVDLFAAATTPLRLLHPHDPQCSDDWCFVVDKAGRDTSDADLYRVSLRIYSRALRVEQRERGLVLYLTGPDGHRYDPIPQPGDVPFDTLLQAGESRMATRTFRVPAAAPGIGAPLFDLWMIKSDNFPISRLVIGRSPFDGRTAVRLN